MLARLLIGILIGAGLLILGVAHHTSLPLILGGGILVVVCGARMVILTRRPGR
jgi:Flp pilus assembly protein TadB